MCDLSKLDLRESFVRRFRPIRIMHGRTGLSAYLFDHYALRFFRCMVTAEPVAPEAIWSVRQFDNDTFALFSGFRQDAIGYVVTEIPQAVGMASSYPLPKRLSYRRKIQAAAIKSLIARLQSAAIDTPADILAVIEQQLREVEKHAA